MPQAFRQRRRRMLARSRAIVAAITNVLGTDELLLLTALLLVAGGFWQVWRPGAFIVPGLVLLYIALPSRSAFIVRIPEKPAKPRS